MAGEQALQVDSLTREIIDRGYLAIPTPFSPSDCAEIGSCFEQILGRYDLADLEARTRRDEGVYDAGWSGYHRTPADPTTGHPVKHSFSVRAATESTPYWIHRRNSQDEPDQDITELYRRSFELLHRARPVMHEILRRLDGEHPDQGVLEQHTHYPYRDETRVAVQDDLRVIMYEGSPPGTELAEPHTDRSSLSIVTTPGGLFVDHNGVRTSPSATLRDNEVVCFPGHRLMHPLVCPGLGFLATVHGAASIGPGRRTVITYQTHPVNPRLRGCSLGEEDYPSPDIAQYLRAQQPMRQPKVWRNPRQDPTRSLHGWISPKM